jgi:Flp pilus assembly protein TadG
VPSFRLDAAQACHGLGVLVRSIGHALQPAPVSFRGPLAPRDSAAICQLPKVAKFRAALHRRQGGQSLVEVAFVVPVLLLLMVGIIEIGRFAYFSVLVSNAAHAGAEYGAQSLISSGDAAGIRQAARNDGQIAGITMTVNPVQLCGCSSTTLAGCPSGGGCAKPLVYIQVTASETVPAMFHFPGIPINLPLSSTVTMRVAQ